MIIYCRSGRRAKLAIETLKARSFDNVSHLEGDMMGWHDAGLPVEKM
ncbi:rhodanese-like domain-containing protein [Salinimonas marina]|uniref:Rhodanese-like domain-containing protein n=1 Tax=Salinimonas marina TaxID=2785918 RepID=A0A7S9DZH2_9ALTE|nr:rhodanese-like domain-containing protein [Salinimonas marina]QPG06220.1 rhodanese-like domain-containing protein [Salinimonas marina]